MCFIPQRSGVTTPSISLCVPITIVTLPEPARFLSATCLCLVQHGCFQCHSSIPKLAGLTLNCERKESIVSKGRFDTLVYPEKPSLPASVHVCAQNCVRGLFRTLSVFGSLSDLAHLPPLHRWMSTPHLSAQLTTDTRIHTHVGCHYLQYCNASARHNRAQTYHNLADPTQIIAASAFNLAAMAILHRNYHLPARLQCHDRGWFVSGSNKTAAPGPIRPADFAEFGGDMQAEIVMADGRRRGEGEPQATGRGDDASVGW